MKKFLDTNKIWMNQILKVWTVQKGTEWVSRSQYFLLLTCCIEKYTHNFNQRLLAQKCRQENGIIWKSLVSFRYFPIHLLAVLLIYSKLKHLFFTFRFNVFPKNLLFKKQFYYYKNYIFSFKDTLSKYWLNLKLDTVVMRSIYDRKKKGKDDGE